MRIREKNSNAWSLYPRDCQASRMSSRSGVSGVRYSVTLINCDLIFTSSSGFRLVQTYADKAHQDNEHRLVRAQRMYVRRTRKHHCGSLALSVNQDWATFMITANMFLTWGSFWGPELLSSWRRPQRFGSFSVIRWSSSWLCPLGEPWCWCICLVKAPGNQTSYWSAFVGFQALWLVLCTLAWDEITPDCNTTKVNSSASFFL